ncbi:putative splicing factor, arginine/serine-rich 6 [Trichinella pseudospiralis]|uniref:Putative splicing factor, arginine/serine-rich 6 n=1 Tax=Trichinella pseudospiralis TaxID=6337 RepID=A0A0V1G2R5_TRIPS|nr:putative splicing factor, arginine/serine-rich 6 [Trichinella pseudospiralis]
MSNREPCPPGCKVYIGGLPQGASQDELREKFEVFGPLRHVWVARNPWGFAFVEFEDSRDAQDSIRGLPERASRGELEEIFGRFGPLRNVWVARRPWGFAFVEFEDARDAIDAVRQLDGSRMCGVRARVELSHGQRRNRGPRGYDDERRGGDRRSFGEIFLSLNKK